MRNLLIGTVVAMALGAVAPGVALACNTYVGNVCLDDKPKAKPKAKKRKTTTKRKAKPAAKPVAPAQPAPVVETADGCITSKYRYVGLTDFAAGHESWITLRNTCGRDVVAYLQLNTCLSGSRPKFAASNRRDGRMQLSLYPGEARQLMVNHQKRRLARGEVLFGGYFYADQGSKGYPAVPCK